jgi:small-conductance mechanosensitive channel
MDVKLNVLGILLAALSSMVIGAIYYSPAVFGKTWLKLAKINEAMYKKDLPKLLPIMFLSALLLSYVLADTIYVEHAFFKDSWMVDSLGVAFWIWLGFSATTLVVHNGLDQKPKKLTAIAIGNRFLSIMTMGLILGLLQP